MSAVYCILVAEDCAAIRLMAVSTLRQHGYCTLQACDGLEALDISHEHFGVIDLLITDISMPNLNGHTLARIIRAERPGIRILVISSEGKDDFPPDAMSYSGSLIKPVSPKQLLGKVESVLAAA
jgi:two-component system, cell cycle sensor histidine kinase and response regulator CckA